jgi:adenylate cyclase
MTIRLKIFAISSLLLLLLGVALGISTWLQQEVHHELDSIASYHQPITAAIAEIDVITFEYEVNLFRLLRNQEVQPELLEVVRQRESNIIARLHTNFDTAENLLRRATADMRNDLSDRLVLARLEVRVKYMRRQVAPFQELGKRVLDTYASGKLQEARALAVGFEKFDEVFGPDLAAIRSELVALTEASTRESLTHQLRLQNFGVVLFVLASLAGLSCSAILAGRLAGALRRLLKGAQAVAEGELHTALPVQGHDEVSRLTAAFNRMTEQLRDTQRIKETFGKYVDPRIVARLIDASGDHPDPAERRLVTVFFSDIQGFTSISEQLTAVVVLNLLNHYFTAVTAVIGEYHGILDKYMGDGIMAFWAPPFSSGDAHAADACLAALAQQQALLVLRQELPNIVGLRRDVPEFKVRMGMATGEAVIGTLGSPTAKSFTVIGDTVNLAARLESINKVYGTTIIITEETERLAQTAIEARELDLIAVVGKSEPVRIFELLTPAGGLSPQQAELCAVFALGLEAYRTSDWETAAQQFHRCLDISPDDGPARLFQQRIATLRTSPPVADWDGVWRMTQK